MIPFNRPPVLEKSFEYMRQAAQEQGKICGDGMFTKRCSGWMEERFQARKVLLTTSCTHALELAALLCDVQPGERDRVRCAGKAQRMEKNYYFRAERSEVIYAMFCGCTACCGVQNGLN